jgi:hypothetical protein
MGGQQLFEGRPGRGVVTAISVLQCQGVTGEGIGRARGDEAA